LFLGLSFVLLLLGIIGWLVPIVTGVPFLVASLAAVAMVSRRVCRWINIIDRKLPYRVRKGLRRCQSGVQRMRAAWRRRKTTLAKLRKKVRRAKEK